MGRLNVGSSMPCGAGWIRSSPLTAIVVRGDEQGSDRRTLLGSAFKMRLGLRLWCVHGQRRSSAGVISAGYIVQKKIRGGS